MIPQDVAAWHAAKRLPQQENLAARLWKCPEAKVRRHCQGGTSTRARIPAGPADRLLRRGTQEWSSQEGHGRWGISDQAGQLCEIRRPPALENARWCMRGQTIHAEQQNLPWFPGHVGTIVGRRPSVWL